ncbi:MAG: hypothetical protein IT210_25615 [Armatimonadetes bacterium]|nr:hypothetical protein [Armatimonadota bacterium]
MPEPNQNITQETTSGRNAPPSPSAAPLTRRAFWLAMLLIPVGAWWVDYTEIVSEGTDMVGLSLATPAVFILFCLLLLNLVLKKKRPALAFSQAELVSIFALFSIGVVISGSGMLQFLISAIAQAFHLASPSNRWEEWLRYLPSWLVPSRSVLPALAKGDSDSVPWGAWLVPVAAWTGFILILLYGMLCLCALLRRQWVDREHLSFPVVAIPMELTSEGGSRLFLRSRLMWIGFGIAFTIETLNSLNHLYPNVPLIQVKPFDIGMVFANKPWNAIGYFPLAFYPLVLGLCYFLPLEVLFSYWFFFLVAKWEDIVCVAFGFRDADAAPSAQRFPFIAEQGAGGFLGVALVSLWMARRQLQAAFRQALRPQPGGEDPWAGMSYRAACLGLVASGLGLFAFCLASGLSPLLGMLFFFIYLLVILAMARVRAEAGTAWLFSPYLNPHGMVVALTGSAGWGTQSLTVFSFLQWFDLSHTTASMPYQMEGLRMAQAARVEAQGFFRAVLAATLVGTLSGFWACLSLYYGYGVSSAKINSWRADMGVVPWRTLEGWLNNLKPPDYMSIQAMGAGAAVVFWLSAMRVRFLWWPFHPIGYAVANTWTMPWLWFPCFLIWLIKLLALRYGGIKGYRQCIPFFVGLLVGDYCAGAVWAIIGAVGHIHIYRCFVI